MSHLTQHTETFTRLLTKPTVSKHQSTEGGWLVSQTGHSQTDSPHRVTIQ